MASSSLKPRDRNRKRFRTEYQQIDLNTSTPEPWFAKFLVVHSNDDTRPLSKVSPFVIAKALEQLIGKEYNAKKLGSGDIQVHVEKREQSSALLSLTSINGISVTVSSHRILNIVKGVISESDLLDCSESELQDGLQQHGVVAVKRIVMRRDGKEIPTKHIILSFKLHKLPDTIKAGYLSCNVRAYIPNPSRCYKCQRFGHGSQVCRGQPVCAKCSGKDHSSESCSNDFQCANCKGNHPVYSRSCPCWKEEKQILKLKTEQNITYSAAKAQLAFQKKGTFSDVVRRGVAPLRVSVETQTSGAPLHTPQHKERDNEGSPPVASQTNSQEMQC
ncbi:uncharacterized protein LOC135375865 [Ornithodoros turicata]|uniref:uncharacterized protein LOC135375865 n=1 Tax=Ornithodoros turicata TaxID=34597 RepID=UPI00313A089C